MIAIRNTPAFSQPPEQMPHKGSRGDDSSYWTCYSAGEPSSDRVMQAAENNSTPADILGMFAESCNVEVRMAVADNRNASLDTLMFLVQDESADLRYQIAENHNIDKRVLKVLAQDPHPYVADRAQRTLARIAGAVGVFAFPLDGPARA